MPILEFREIPEAHIATGEQDSFELFARDFLRLLGYEVVEGPDRGADDGRDLIVEEVRTGIGGVTAIKWLVSCKHKAHSGKSVSKTDESDVLDRVKAQDCQGFMGFYSTLPSSGLASALRGLKKHIEVQVFDRGAIEAAIISHERLQLAERYFPNSVKKWKKENPKPVEIFSNQESLRCQYCDKNLMDPPSGIVVIWRASGANVDADSIVIDIYWSCKGDCDDILSGRSHQSCQAWVSARFEEMGIENDWPPSVFVTDGWEDIADLCIPTVYLRWMMAALNQLRSGVRYTDPAFGKFKKFVVSIFPQISRELTTMESERIANSYMILPDILGGFGNSV